MASPEHPPPLTGAGLRVVPQQTRGIRKLARILDAADEIMAAEGWDAVTTTRVAQAADVSVGTLYRYLPHRDAILEGLTERHLLELAERLDTLLQLGVDQPAGTTAGTITVDGQPVDLVGRLVDEIAGFYRSRPGFCSLRFFGPITSRMREFDAAYRDSTAAALRRLLLAQGYDDADDELDSACEMLQLATAGVINEAFRTEPQGDRLLLERLTEMIRTVVATLLPDRAAAR